MIIHNTSIAMQNCGAKCGAAKVAWVLVLVGALNWGLVGLGMFLGGNWNVVELILGRVMWLEALVYILVGVSAVVALFGCKCKTCKTDRNNTPAQEQMSSSPMNGGGM